MTFAVSQYKITAVYVTQFHDTFEILAQQKESRLLKTVHNRNKITSDRVIINDIGTLEMKVSARFGVFNGIFFI